MGKRRHIISSARFLASAGVTDRARDFGRCVLCSLEAKPGALDNLRAHLKEKRWLDESSPLCLASNLNAVQAVVLTVIFRSKCQIFDLR